MHIKWIGDISWCLETFPIMCMFTKQNNSLMNSWQNSLRVNAILESMAKIASARLLWKAQLWNVKWPKQIKCISKGGESMKGFYIQRFTLNTSISGQLIKYNLYHIMTVKKRFFGEYFSWNFFLNIVLFSSYIPNFTRVIGNRY